MVLFIILHENKMDYFTKCSLLFFIFGKNQLRFEMLTKLGMDM